MRGWRWRTSRAVLVMRGAAHTERCAGTIFNHLSANLARVLFSTQLNKALPYLRHSSKKSATSSKHNKNHRANRAAKNIRKVTPHSSNIVAVLQHLPYHLVLLQYCNCASLYQNLYSLRILKIILYVYCIYIKSVIFVIQILIEIVIMYM